jgi:hypothetical protein
MDLGLMLRVLWRFRLLVALGFLGAVGLAVLSYARVDLRHSPHLKPREREQWMSSATLFISPSGFPWGRIVGSVNADPGRFGEYATLYARLATSDPVKRIMVRQGSVDETHELIQAYPVLSSDFNTDSPPLPLVQVNATAATARRARTLARRESEAFRQYIAVEQRANGIPVARRVNVTIVKRAQPAQLLKGRSKTLPIVIFMTVMIATCGLAFVLENLRPRVRAVAAEEAPPPAEAARRSA